MNEGLVITPFRSHRAYIIQQIEETVSSYVASLAKNERPILHLPHLDLVQQVIPGEDVESLRELCKPNKLTRLTADHHRRVLYLLSFVHSRLIENAPPTTLREIFYRNVTMFTSQTEVDNTVLDIAAMLGVERGDLAVTASRSGSILGPVLVHMRDGRTVDCSMQPQQITEGLVDGCTFSVTASVQAIVVVEKEGVLAYLHRQHFTHNHPCIVITGNGYPSLGCRQLLHSLHAALALPCLGIFDMNPHGVNIWLQYHQSGSALLGGSRYAVPSLVWGGMSATDAREMIAQGVMREQDVVPFTEGDRRLCRKLLSNPAVINAARVKEEVASMSAWGVKLELQSAMQVQYGYLAQVWLPLKLRELVDRRS